MRKIIILLVLILLTPVLRGQAPEIVQVEGRVSYLSQQNVYVRFPSTQGISVGDTLYMLSDGVKVPALVVKQRSSISCVTQTIGSAMPEIDMLIVADAKIIRKTVEEKPKVTIADEVTVEKRPKQKKKSEQKQTIHGRLSVASYSNFSNTQAADNLRMRYTFSLQGENLGGSNISTESYMTFTHKSGEWNRVTDNLFNGLKIYSLAARYDFNDHTNVWVGRKINPLVANIGAIDGAQFETKVKNFTFGLAGGTRPDYLDYSFNVSLVQFGGYVAHQMDGEMGSAQSSLAIFEQKNGAHTDRRFTYFQHSNSMIKNLHIFASCELDLFKLENGVAKNTLDVTGLYLSARYRPWRQLSLFGSYDARKNVVYYETFRNLADEILEQETRQGYRFQIMVRPFNYFTFSANAGYRFRKDDPSASQNASAFMTYSRLPWVHASLTLQATYLKTGYLDGLQYGGNLSKDFLDGKLYGSLNYRVIDYNFSNSPTGMFQHVGEASLSWRLHKKLSVSANYEGTIENENLFNRLYLGIIQRF